MACFASFELVLTGSRRLTSLLISRFLINLQSVNKQVEASGTLTGTPTNQESIVFERGVMGSLSASLGVPGEDDVFDDAECRGEEVSMNHGSCSRLLS